MPFLVPGHLLRAVILPPLVASSFSSFFLVFLLLVIFLLHQHSAPLLFNQQLFHSQLFTQFLLTVLIVILEILILVLLYVLLAQHGASSYEHAYDVQLLDGLFAHEFYDFHPHAIYQNVRQTTILVHFLPLVLILLI